MEKGAGWFATVGSTKVFSLSGDIAKPGLVEVPMGTTLREIVEDLGGGTAGGRQLKAVQIGGPSGGLIPAGELDMKMDFDSLGEAGMMMGSGDITVIDDRADLVEIVRQRLEFLSGESCGKCTPCREGLFALKNTLTRIFISSSAFDNIRTIVQQLILIREFFFASKPDSGGARVNAIR